MLLITAGDVEINPGPGYSDSSTCRDLSIFHINIRSIRNKLSQIYDDISDFDILCFTESHLDCNVTNTELMLDHFHSPFRRDRNSFGGGIIVYFSNHLYVSNADRT